MKIIPRIAFILAGLTLTSYAALAQRNSLDARIHSEIAPFKGKVYLFAKNLDTGASFGINEDSRVRTASTIKTAIMVEAFARVAEGKANWSDEVVLTNTKKVGGSGILQELSERD